MNHPTPYSKDLRFRWYRLVEREQRSVRDACATFGIPRKTYYKWHAHDHGKTSAAYHAAQRQPETKLTAVVKQFIEQTKQKTNYGPAKMRLAIQRAFNLTVSTTIIYRYFRKRHLIRKPQRKLPWYEPMKERLVLKMRGEGVQMDVKYVYEGGVRKYQFSVFDPFTELFHFTVFATRESKNAIAALLAAQTFFGFSILSVQTDNGSEFRGDFHGWLQRHGIPHYFIPKKSPWWNAQVERVHRTIDDEYYQNPNRVWKTAVDWLYYYNEERIHLTLNGLTPREKALESVTP